MSRYLDEMFGSFVVEVSTRVDVAPKTVWDLVTDISRISDFSPEVIKAEWIEPGPQGPVVGARFAGTNRLGDFEWTRTCTVVEATPPCVFAYVVGDRFDGSPSGRWSFEIGTDEDGTRLSHRFIHAPKGRSGTRLLADQDPENAERIIETRREILEKGMDATLASIKRVLEKGR